MTNAELIQLNPQHIAELRSFYEGINFDNVDIVAKEVGLKNFEESTLEFSLKFNQLRLDGVFRGKLHTHCVFSSDEDDTFFCVSFAKIGKVEERIIFKLTTKKG